MCLLMAIIRRYKINRWLLTRMVVQPRLTIFWFSILGFCLFWQILWVFTVLRVFRGKQERARRQRSVPQPVTPAKARL
jgi:hypothetical protein